MSKIEISLLNKNNIFGQNKLSFIERIYSYKYTDFAQILGVSISNIVITQSLYSDTNTYLLATLYDGKELYTDIYSADTAIRPVIKYLDIQKYISSETINTEGLPETEFGEFPQERAPYELERILEDNYLNNKLVKLKQVFTTYKLESRYKFNLESETHIVYEFEGKKYIRIIGRYNSYYSNYSNNIIWIEVKPIKWIIDKEKNLVISKYAIMSGIPFDNTRTYTGNFSNTLLYRYLNSIFIKEISTGLDIEPITNEVIISKIEKPNREENVIKYYMLCNKLKTLIRKGWKVWSVNSERLESVAEHIYGVQMLAIAMKSEYKYSINLERVILMLAIHELGEIIIGDYTPFEITKEEKHKIECEAVQKVLGSLIDKETLYNLFLDFDNQISNEAKFAFMCDKLECDIQCRIYDEDGCVDIETQRSSNPVEDAKVQKQLQTGKSWSELWITNDQEAYNYDKNFKAVSNYILTHKIRKI